MDDRNGLMSLDRLSDRFFKYLFATEEHKDLLIALLNEVLLDLDPEGSARRIEDVTYGDRDSSPLCRDAKLPRFLGVAPPLFGGSSFSSSKVSHLSSSKSRPRGLAST